VILGFLAFDLQGNYAHSFFPTLLPLKLGKLAESSVLFSPLLLYGKKDEVQLISS